MVYHELVVTWARWSWRCGGRCWSGSWGSSCGVGRLEVSCWSALVKSSSSVWVSCRLLVKREMYWEWCVVLS
eukprot:1584412-Alexandrium_andersonii.AAC.1